MFYKHKIQNHQINNTLKNLRTEQKVTKDLKCSHLCGKLIAQI